MSAIDDLSFFQQVATHASLTEVGRQLGLSLPAVSKRLSQLEARLGAQLVQRTTRRLSLTAEGTLYLEGGRPILRQLEELENALDRRHAELHGRLRINATLGFGRRHLAAVMSSFAHLHPALELQLELSSEPLGFADDRFDLAVCMGTPPDSRLVAVRMLDNPRVLCAAPAYLQHHPAPQRPEDLARHNCIVLRQFGSDYALWRFEHGGQMHTQKVSGTLASNDGEVAVSLALEGHGLLLRSRWDVHEHLQSGRLQEVMTGYTPPPAHIHAVYPHSRHVPRRISLFVAHLKAALGERLPFSALT